MRAGKQINLLKTNLSRLKVRIANFYKRDERIDEAKNKWNMLAKKNAAHYVLTDKSVSSEDEFRSSGQVDANKYFLQDDIIKTFLKKGESVVLEIGCGIGRISEFIAPHVKNLHAVDISEEMIRKAKMRLNHIGNIFFQSTDGENFPLEGGSVDLVFSFIVFQHMPSVKIIRNNIEEIDRVLKKGGLAKIQLRGMPVSKDKWFYGPDFDKSRVEKLIEGTSFSILKSEGEGQRYFWVWLKK